MLLIGASAEIPDDRDEAVIMLAGAVAQRLAKLIFIPIEDIDIGRPFSHFGLDGTIFDTLKTKTAAAETATNPAIVDSTSQKTANGSLDSNGVNGSTGVNCSNGFNGMDSSSAESQMEKFSWSVRRAIADSKPVMHSYVCSVISNKGEQLYTLSEGTLSQDFSTKVGFDAVYGMASLTKLMITVAIMISCRSIDMDTGRIEIALGGPLYLDTIPGKRSAGTLQWAGRPNLFWWIDRVKGVAAATFTQVISQADTRFEELTSEFEMAVYAEFT
ncbi:hypothetical protein PENVUL_c018G07985 [Penicillium vulpinum]|uniref:Beta-lactamase-related domain-containing protein n=2 Tax=Penicillium vulpinum TaxID=29845 RepID=A0A1V6RY97_9EURO|nr:hypothetical protein PENVUL_c018G07985 [Penicillium vulpinum]